MSLRSFTVLAHSSRKREDLYLRPAPVHSLPRPRSFALHGVAQEADLRTVSADRQRCGRLPSAAHPLPAGQRRVGGAAERRLRRAGCESYASLSRHLQTDVSVERHLSRIRPCLTRSLARCLSRALRHGTALLRLTTPSRNNRVPGTPMRRPKGFRLSKNLFGKSPHRTRTKRFSEPSEKAPFGLGSGAHSRRFA
jgi:hypothetical protein